MPQWRVTEKPGRLVENHRANQGKMYCDRAREETLDDHQATV
ncbi:hypothetical protein VCHA34P126_50130 [Vibrio chagasii]|nr:hypothetical protein VCHA34P126_50130 [Vibrio chagasii]